MKIEEAYEALYQLVEAKHAAHFILTSSGAEGVNHAVFAAYLDQTRKTGKNHFISASTDEAPAIMAMSRLSELGCIHEMAPVNEEGIVTAHAIAETLTPRTAMVSLSWANGLTGVVQPVAEIAQVCRERGVLFHVEATHVIGKGYYTLESSGADLLTFDGLPGTGGLFIREGVEISPLIVGGDEQAHMRAGSLNVPGLLALGQQAKEQLRFRDHLCMEGARLRDRFEEKVGKGFCSDQERVPHISAQIFPGVASDCLLYLLKRRGIRNASFGGGSFQHLKHILEACGLEGVERHCGMSFSFSHETTEEEVNQGAKRVLEIVEQVQTTWSL
ncbi:MAG: Cysteine desulfurase IscS [Chlamydiales bacterium]|nr:Cysteine desulfurase IscS [Chlamydiales bacterium]